MINGGNAVTDIEEIREGLGENKLVCYHPADTARDEMLFMFGICLRTDNEYFWVWDWEVARR